MKLEIFRALLLLANLASRMLVDAECELAKLPPLVPPDQLAHRSSLHKRGGQARRALELVDAVRGLTDSGMEFGADDLAELRVMRRELLKLEKRDG